MTSGWAPVL